MARHRSSGLRGWEIILGLLAAVVIIAGSWSLWTGQRSDATSTPTRPPTATTAAKVAIVTSIASATTAPPSPTSTPFASAPLATATTAPATVAPALSPTVAAARGVTATPDMAGAGHVSELDPAIEARRQVVGTVGDGALGDRAATLLGEFYAALPRAYLDRKPELLRPLLADDAYAATVRGIARAHGQPQLSVPIIAHRTQPTVLTNLRPRAYTITTAEIRYYRALDPATGKVISTSRPYRECVRWFLVEADGALKIEGSTTLPERVCDAGWPDPVTPTTG